MRKTFYFFMAWLLAFHCALTAQPLSVKSSETAVPTDGFAYADRYVALNTLEGPRVAKFDNLITAAIRTPDLKTPHTLTAVSFPLLNFGDDEGSILVLNKSHQIIYKQPARLVKGWNTITLPQPLTLQGGVFYIGYCCHIKSTLPRSQWTEDPGLHLVAFDNKETIPNSSYLGVDASDEVLKVGDVPGSKVVFEEQSALEEGNLMLVAHLSGSALNNLAYMTAIKGDLIGAAGSDITLRAHLVNVGMNDISQATISFLLNGNYQEVPLNTLVAKGERKDVELSMEIPTSGLAFNGYGLLYKVNGVANALCNPALSLSGKVLQPGGFVRAKNVLLEEYTTEFCSMCPKGAERVSKLIAKLQGEGYRVSVISHHAGIRNDFLSIQPSTDLVASMYNHQIGVGNPALVVNRLNIGVGGAPCIFTNNAPYDKFESEILKVVHTNLQAAQITKMVFNADSLYVEGIVIKKGMDISHPYVHIVLTENDVVGKNQYSADNKIIPGYIHDHVARKFLFPIEGVSFMKYVDWANYNNENIPFKIAFNTAELGLDPSWKKEHLQAVAFVTGPFSIVSGAEYNSRAVMCSEHVRYNSRLENPLITGIDEVYESSLQPTISIANGLVHVAGAYEGIMILDMRGVVVSNNISTPLTAGNYIVRLRTQKGTYTYKINVR